MDTLFKIVIVAVIVIVLVGAAFWVGGRNGHTTPSPLPSVPVPIGSAIVTAGPSQTIINSGRVGNNVGDIAPDFPGLREYRGQEVSLRFATANEIILQGATRNDADGTIHRLYNVTFMPYTVTINSQGIITNTQHQ